MQTLPTAAIFAVASAIALSGTEPDENAEANFGVHTTGKTPNINGGGKTCAGVNTKITSGPEINNIVKS